MTDLVERIEKSIKELEEKVAPSFQAYRQAGLGLSATFLTFDLILIKLAVDKIKLPLTSWSFSSVICLLVLLIAVVFAVGIQVANYRGLKLVAERHVVPTGEEAGVWFIETTRSSNIWFTRSTQYLNISIVSTAVGLIFVIYFWVFRG
jgi:hypothetical protein